MLVGLLAMLEAPALASLVLTIVQRQAEVAADDEALTQILAELVQLSEDTVRTILADETQVTKKEGIS
jgi:hypothetical protein